MVFALRPVATPLPDVQMQSEGGVHFFQPSRKRVAEQPESDLQVPRWSGSKAKLGTVQFLRMAVCAWLALMRLAHSGNHRNSDGKWT